MSLLLIILVVVAVLVIGLVLFISSRPNEFRITRNLAMAVPPAVVFSHVNDLHRWQAWSPWAKLDPNAANNFEGPAEGPGSAMSWEGNKQVGSGKMTITTSRPPERVEFRLDFYKPFPGTNTAEFTFTSNGDGTMVTWSMAGKANFMMKAVGLFMNCDAMVGGQFEQGLRDLKTLVEGEAGHAATGRL